MSNRSSRRSSIRSRIVAKEGRVIDCDLARVWDFVLDPRNEPRWHTDMLAIERAGDLAPEAESRWRLGESFQITVSFMGRRDYEAQITGLEVGRSLQITTKTGPIRPTVTYLLEEVGASTRFTRLVDVPVTGLFRLATPMLRKDFRKKNAIFVQNLKDLLES